MLPTRPRFAGSSKAKVPQREIHLVSHGTADRVVPFWQAERLFAAAREPKRFWRVEGGKHGPPNQPEFFEAVKAFLAETASR
jgi:fermentation-respiration switch protein FrsA (DUF1100 family)